MIMEDLRKSSSPAVSGGGSMDPRQGHSGMTAIRFGTDGWRGVVSDDFTFHNLRQVASATASYIKAHPGGGNGSVVVGYDRRFLSRAFAEDVVRCLAAFGIPVQLSATPSPTPAVSFSVVHRKASWGIMITASHNPAPYNGFKIKDRYGRSAPPEVTREIEAHLNLSSSFPAVPGRGSMDSPPTTAGNDGIKTFDDRAAYASSLK